MTLDRSRPLLLRLMILAVLVLVTPLALISFRAMGEFERDMIPEMDKKAAAIGRDVAAQVSRAVGYGIPADRLVGVNEFFAPVLQANPEIRYLAIAAADGHVLFVKGADATELDPRYSRMNLTIIGADGHKSSVGKYLDLALPLTGRTGVAGYVHVGYDEDYISAHLTDILADEMVVGAASLLIAFEILLFVVFVNVSGPLKLVKNVIAKAAEGDFGNLPGGRSDDEVGRFVAVVQKALRQIDGQYRRLAAYMDEVRQAHFDKDVVTRVGIIAERFHARYRFSPTGAPTIRFEPRATDIRLALFLFVFAEELSRSFLPLFAGTLTGGRLALSAEMAMALPIATFMGAIALASPWGGQLAQRLGARRLFLIGVVPCVLGSLLTGLAVGVLDLALWRALTGLGYALVTVACQSYISASLNSERRAQGLGVYVGAVLTAGICGNAMGGVLAERVGYRVSFFVSAALVVLSSMLVSRLLAPTELTPPPTEAGTTRPIGHGEPVTLLRNRRFGMMMLFAAVPAKLALTGFLFFLVPVTLVRADLDVSSIARVMVLYPLVMVAVSPLAARLADQRGWRARLVALGGLVGGLGILAPLAFGPGVLPVAVAVIALGVSHGLSASPMLALLPDLCGKECAQMGYTNVLAFVRFVERIGSVAGPLLTAAAIPFLGLWGAAMALGGVVLVLALVFAVATLTTDMEQPAADGPAVDGETRT